MPPHLLERDNCITSLLAAAHNARGAGSFALVSGEAGIGKTSVVSAFAARAAPAKVLVGSCFDLRTPHTYGALWDAAGDGPLRSALGHGVSEAVCRAAEQELSAHRPTVLILEDVHWADDATLDVLRYLAHRIVSLPAVIVVTYRDDELHSRHPLHQLLGALKGAPVLRHQLAPLSPTAVRALSEGVREDWAHLHKMTGGNPFFVAEALRARQSEVPPTVLDAVLARAQHLSPQCLRAVEQLAVLPAQVGFAVAEELLGDGMELLTNAEERGILRIHGDQLVFRHELVRQAIEQSLPTLRRRALSRTALHAVLALEPGAGKQRDLSQVMHLAVAAHDAETIIRFAPLAGRQAAAAGSHRQALAHFEAAMEYADALDLAARADLVDAYAWELHIAHRFSDAVQAGREAVALRERVPSTDVVTRSETLLRLSRHLFMNGNTDAAEEVVGSACSAARLGGDLAAQAAAETYRGAILTLTSRPREAVEVLEAAHRIAVSAHRTDLVALCLNYLGTARCDLGENAGVVLLRESLSAARSSHDHESEARGYTNLVEVLYRLGQWAEAATLVHEGLHFTCERGFWSHAYNLRVHQALLRMRGGDWDGAEQLLRQLTDGMDDPGMLYVYSVPALGRMLARRGNPAAGTLLTAAWERALRQRSLVGMAYAGIGFVEWAWLNGEGWRAEEVGKQLLRELELPGAAAFRGELLRYLRRAGTTVPGTSLDGVLEAHEAGLRGSWREAAEGWERVGDSYEAALELSESGDGATLLRALRQLDSLGAAPAAALVRRALCSLGFAAPPVAEATVVGNGRRVSGAAANTAPPPAHSGHGLTLRQRQVLDLLAHGLTNAEIAQRLVVSVRTVDHHVAAVFAKLGVHTRRQAAAHAPGGRALS